MKARVFFSAAITAVILCSTAAGAADWEPYWGDQYFSYLYDAQSIEHPYRNIFNVLKLEFAKTGIVSVWTKRIIQGVKGREWQVDEQKKQGSTTRGYERYEYTLSRKEVSCSEKKYSVLSEADYNKDGEVLSSFSKEAQFADLKPIPPDSDTEALYHAICGKQDESSSGQSGPSGQRQKNQ